MVSQCDESFVLTLKGWVVIWIRRVRTPGFSAHQRIDLPVADLKHVIHPYADGRSAYLPPYHDSAKCQAQSYTKLFFLTSLGNCERTKEKASRANR